MNKEEEVIDRVLTDEDIKEPMEDIDESAELKAHPANDLYIGCKVIKAVPMLHSKFLESKGESLEHEDSPGYQVTYPDGYVSWSPMRSFDLAYRKITPQEYNFITNG